MSRVLFVCALVAGVLALPGAAGAQEGNGPYAPFPSVSDDAPGDAWYALMDADLSASRLADGAFAGDLGPVAGDSAAASARAGVGVAGVGPGPALAGLLLAAIAVAAAVVAGRRTRKGNA